MSAHQPSEVARSWLQRAHSDLALGEVALATPGVMLEDACFHAQQCAEKGLKGLLAYLEIDFPRTHAIEVLLDLLKSKGVAVPEDVDEAFGLSQYAVQSRYPGIWDAVTRQDADSALMLASLVLKWVERQIPAHK